MDFENLTETILFELVLEGIGTIFAFGFLWRMFFHSGLSTILTLFITSIC